MATNRKTRRAAQARAAKTPKKTPPPQSKEGEQPEVDAELEANKRIQEMVEGKLDPPNKFVSYLVGKLRESRQELIQTQKSHSNLMTMVQRAEKEMVGLQSECRKYAEDIRAWDKEVLSGGGGSEVVDEPKEEGSEETPPSSE